MPQKPKRHNDVAYYAHIAAMNVYDIARRTLANEKALDRIEKGFKDAFLAFESEIRFFNEIVPTKDDPHKIRAYQMAQEKWDMVVDMYLQKFPEFEKRHIEPFRKWPQYHYEQKTGHSYEDMKLLHDTFLEQERKGKDSSSIYY